MTMDQMNFSAVSYYVMYNINYNIMTCDGVALGNECLLAVSV